MKYKRIVLMTLLMVVASVTVVGAQGPTTSPVERLITDKWQVIENDGSFGGDIFPTKYNPYRQMFASGLHLQSFSDEWYVTISTFLNFGTGPFEWRTQCANVNGRGHSTRCRPFTGLEITVTTKILRGANGEFTGEKHIKDIRFDPKVWSRVVPQFIIVK